MVVLDSDHMSFLQRGGSEGQRIAKRLRSFPPEEVTTTIINYEEQMRGWLARLARATTLERQVSDYAELGLLLRRYCGMNVVGFGAKAGAQFERLRQVPVRIGTLDLRIAAIALTNDAILLTRNLTDFRKVPNLDCQDWSL